MADNGDGQTGSEPKVTMRDNKKTIFAAYRAMKDKHEKEESGRVDQSGATAAAESEELIGNMRNISVEGILRQFDGIRSSVATALSTMSGDISEAKQQLEKLTEAREAQEQFLEETYGIVAQAGSLAALIDAQEEERGKFESEMATKREEAKREEQQLTASYDDKASDLRREYDRKAKELAFEFDVTSRKCQQELDDRRKEVETELAARESTVAAAELELEELRGFREVADVLKSEAVGDACAELRAQLGTTHDWEIRELKQSLQAQIDRLTERNETLTTKVAELAASEKAMRAQLEAAQQKVVEISREAIAGAQKREYLHIGTGDSGSVQTNGNGRGK